MGYFLVILPTPISQCVCCGGHICLSKFSNMVEGREIDSVEEVGKSFGALASLLIKIKE